MSVGSIGSALLPALPLGALRPYACPLAPDPEPRDGLDASPKPAFNRSEMLARYSCNLLLHLGLSDGPNVLGIIANVVPLPPQLAWAVSLSNLANTLTGLPAIVADLREIRGTLKNPVATRTDRIVDVAHFLGGDVLGTAGSLIPFCFPMSNPLAMGVFLGTQLACIGADLAKTAYDWHRRGQQSAYREGQAAAGLRSGSSANL